MLNEHDVQNNREQMKNYVFEHWNKRKQLTNYCKSFYDSFNFRLREVIEKNIYSIKH